MRPLEEVATLTLHTRLSSGAADGVQVQIVMRRALSAIPDITRFVFDGSVAEAAVEKTTSGDVRLLGILLVIMSII